MLDDQIQHAKQPYATIDSITHAINVYSTKMYYCLFDSTTVLGHLRTMCLRALEEAGGQRVARISRYITEQKRRSGSIDPSRERACRHVIRQAGSATLQRVGG